MTDLTHEELVEKVARALCVAEGHNPDETYGREEYRKWRLFKHSAEAAISTIFEALKEPTEAMIDAGAQRLVRCGEEPSVWPGSYDSLDVAAARQEAGRVLLSGFLASPLNRRE